MPNFTPALPKRGRHWLNRLVLPDARPAGGGRRSRGWIKKRGNWKLIFASVQRCLHSTRVRRGMAVQLPPTALLDARIGRTVRLSYRAQRRNRKETKHGPTCNLNSETEHRCAVSSERWFYTSPASVPEVRRVDATGRGRQHPRNVLPPLPDVPLDRQTAMANRRCAEQLIQPIRLA